MNPIYCVIIDSEHNSAVNKNISCCSPAANSLVSSVISKSVCFHYFGDSYRQHDYKVIPGYKASIFIPSHLSYLTKLESSYVCLHLDLSNTIECHSDPLKQRNN